MSAPFLAILLAFACQITFAQDTTVKRLYYPSGKLHAEMSYVGNTPNGFFREYTEQGQIRVEEYYLNGQVDSVRREYYDSGQLKSEFRFRQGLRHGTAYEFYESGKVQSQATYRNDTLLSTVKYYFYHPNGRLREEASVNANGRLHGIRRTYHSNGALESEERYVDGVRMGDARRYTATGTLKLIRTYKDDLPDGEELIYSDDGKLEEVNTYRLGEKISVKRYDERGYLVEELDERAILRQRQRRPNGY
jgi:antitoxin component YwqK of YwqJK toxin-antitoxin module